jgi:hypothetical protein
MTFQKAITPGEEVCIDETVVPFHGRLYFEQYIPGKRFKYGVKMYKLCAEGGYTWSVKVYCGREHEVTDVTLTTVL